MTAALTCGFLPVSMSDARQAPSSFLNKLYDQFPESKHSAIRMMRSSRRQGRGERYREGRRRPEGPSLRLFIAAEIPPPATRKLAGWQTEFLASDRSLRLVPEAQLHITLIFLGQMGEEELQGAAGQLAELRQQDPLTSFEVTAGGLVGLSKGRNLRVIAASLEEPAGRLKAIHDELAAGLVQKKIYKREKRRFFPHVTIARARGRVALNPAEIRPDPVKFTAVRITLYNSILKPSGAIHQALETVQLN